MFDKIDNVLGIDRKTVLFEKEVDDVEPDLLWRAAFAAVLRTRYNEALSDTKSMRRAERIVFGETHDVPFKPSKLEMRIMESRSRIPIPKE